MSSNSSRATWLTGNRHLDQVLRKYTVPKGPGTAVYEAGERLRGLIQRWYSTRLVRVTNSGSFAKRTSIRGGTDLDLFVSLKPRTGRSLARIYEGLYRYAEKEGLGPRRQNVSIGVQTNGVKVDLVPARKHTNSDDHSLYLNRQGGWTKTNIDKHIELVRQSGKTAAIRAAKIWRTNHGLHFPSFYLELTVLRALQSQTRQGTADELAIILDFLGRRFSGERFIDPANDSNVISSDLSMQEKQAIARQASVSSSYVQRGEWEKIVW